MEDSDLMLVSSQGGGGTSLICYENIHTSISAVKGNRIGGAGRMFLLVPSTVGGQAKISPPAKETK